MLRLLALSVALFCTSATAQVYRCKLPSGQMSYSNQPCADPKAGALVQEQRSEADLMREREMAREMEMRKMERKINAMEQAQAQQQYQQRQQPAMQTQPQQSTRETPGCRMAQRDLESASGSIYRNNDEKRSAINAAIAKANAACGSKTELMQEPARITVTPRHSTCIQTGAVINCN